MAIINAMSMLQLSEMQNSWMDSTIQDGMVSRSIQKARLEASHMSEQGASEAVVSPMRQTDAYQGYRNTIKPAAVVVQVASYAMIASYTSNAIKKCQDFDNLHNGRISTYLQNRAKEEIRPSAFMSFFTQERKAGDMSVVNTTTKTGKSGKTITVQKMKLDKISTEGRNVTYGWAAVHNHKKKDAVRFARNQANTVEKYMKVQRANVRAHKKDARILRKLKQKQVTFDRREKIKVKLGLTAVPKTYSPTKRDVKLKAKVQDPLATTKYVPKSKNSTELLMEKSRKLSKKVDQAQKMKNNSKHGLLRNARQTFSRATNFNETELAQGMSKAKAIYRPAMMTIRLFTIGAGGKAIRKLAKKAVINTTATVLRVKSKMTAKAAGTVVKGANPIASYALRRSEKIASKKAAAELLDKTGKSVTKFVDKKKLRTKLRVGKALGLDMKSVAKNGIRKTIQSRIAAKFLSTKFGKAAGKVVSKITNNALIKAATAVAKALASAIQTVMSALTTVMSTIGTVILSILGVYVGLILLLAMIGSVMNGVIGLWEGTEPTFSYAVDDLDKMNKRYESKAKNKTSTGSLWTALGALFDKDEHYAGTQIIMKNDEDDYTFYIRGANDTSIPYDIHLKKGSKQENYRELFSLVSGLYTNYGGIKEWFTLEDNKWSDLLIDLYAASHEITTEPYEVTVQNYKINYWSWEKTETDTSTYVGQYVIVDILRGNDVFNACHDTLIDQATAIIEKYNDDGKYDYDLDYEYALASFEGAMEKEEFWDTSSDEVYDGYKEEVFNAKKGMIASAVDLVAVTVPKSQYTYTFNNPPDDVYIIKKNKDIWGNLKSIKYVYYYEEDGEKIPYDYYEMASPSKGYYKWGNLSEEDYEKIYKKLN